MRCGLQKSAEKSSFRRGRASSRGDKKPAPTSLRVGIDTGGTFTDFIWLHNGRFHVRKRFSTAARPEQAVLQGLAGLEPSEVVHGSTVATNALLERKGARIALLTTAGFEDVLVIGRQTRRELYNIFVSRPEPLVPETLRFGVRERTLHDGSIAQPLDRDQIEDLASLLKREGVRSVAVCLLFSFANAHHEEEVARILATEGIQASLSSFVLPEYREYERTSTTVVNAYLIPRMGEYLTRLRESLPRARLRVMQSSGGAITAAAASASPVRTIVSGPAGGVVGAFHVARLSGYPRIVTFDMGGTSTDVALCDKGISMTHEAQVDGMPIGIPMIDIHTVGAGGGSIARLDPGGALRVGPESAGADPGPICYGRGGQAFTVTDANVLLGRLPPRFFLGGEATLAVNAIAPAIRNLPRHWNSPQQFAQGVLDVVNNNMEQALRLISIERGHDTSDYALVSFGGAGGLHAADLAQAVGIPRVVVPQFPGALSALGLLLSDARKDYSRSLLIPLAGAAGRVSRELGDLHRVGRQEMKVEGFAPHQIRQQDYLDLRYQGQSYELTVPLTGDVAARFHRMHQQRYGYSDAGRSIELVSVRAVFIGLAPKVKLVKHPKERRKPVPVEKSDVWFAGRRLKTSVYDRAQLHHGQSLDGPAIVGEYSATTLIPPGWTCQVDAFLNLVLTRMKHED